MYSQVSGDEFVSADEEVASVGSGQMVTDRLPGVKDRLPGVTDRVADVGVVTEQSRLGPLSKVAYYPITSSSCHVRKITPVSCEKILDVNFNTMKI